MKTAQTITILLTLAMLSCCNRAPEAPMESGPVISLEKSDVIDLSPYLEDIRLIPLEGHPGSLFSQADHMVLEGSDLYIMDKTLKAIICFDTTGRFRYRIQRVGKGPGEYPELNGFWIRPEKNELYLHSRIPPKILVYDLEGHYLRETPVDYGAHEMTGLGKDMVTAFSIFNSYRGRDSISPGIFLMREDGAFISQNKPIGEYTPYWAVNYQRHMEKFEDGLLVMSQSDTIYRVEANGRVSIDMILDPGKMKMPDELRQVPFNSPQQPQIFNSSYMQCKDQLIAFGPIRLFWFSKENQQHFVLIDKKLSKGYYSQSIQNSHTLFPTVFPIGSGNQDELVGIYNMDVIWLLQESLEASRTERPDNLALKGIEKIIQEAIAQDRPIVYIARVKKEWLN